MWCWYYWSINHPCNDKGIDIFLRNHCHLICFYLLYYYFFIKSIVDLQHCANFCCTAKWLSYTYTFFKYDFPSWSIPGDWNFACFLFFIFLRFLFLPILLIFHVLSISTVQQSDPVTLIYTFFFSHRPPSQVNGFSSLCYTEGSHCLSTANAIVCIY